VTAIRLCGCGVRSKPFEEKYRRILITD
jgi:hypothetical protein